MTERSILVTGATGYIGGRLVRILIESGHRVRCLARKPEILRARFGDRVEVVQGDVMNKASLEKALSGIETAFYLVHSMGEGDDFEALEKTGATNFGEAARDSSLQKIIYLGGLGAGRDLSPHLRSRHEVGRLLNRVGTPVLEFRASIIVGSGSLSFEMIRALVERLPVMITPRWVSTKAQPLAISDLLMYLVQAIDIPVESHSIYEIGGADQVSYGDLMREYARQRGLHRLTVPVPVLSPRLSSLWLGLVTPLYVRTGRKLIDSLRHATIVLNHDAEKVFTIHPRGVRKAIADALKNEDKELAETRWSDSLSAAGPIRGFGGRRVGNRLVDRRTATVQATSRQAFRPIREIGGEKGWYYADWLWRVRGFLDLLVGGVGMRRGRRSPTSLAVGDVIDWWRVETYEDNSRLQLAAEMRLPGRAWLEFTVEENGGSCRIQQTAIFDPIGLPGVLYWYGVYPLHALVFRGMLAGIARAAMEQVEQELQKIV